MTDKIHPDEILERTGRRDGLTTPEGWHDDFVARMKAALPERPEIERPASIVTPPRTLWQRVRPYVYMAAMFAGMWCMLKMFTMMSPTPIEGMDSNPVLAEAFANEDFVNQYIYDDLSQWDVIDDLIDSGIDLDTFCDSIYTYDYEY